MDGRGMDSSSHVVMDSSSEMGAGGRGVSFCV